MSHEYKVGDKVRVLASTSYRRPHRFTEEMIGTICEIKQEVDRDGEIQVWNADKTDWWYFYPVDVEPFTAPAPVPAPLPEFKKGDRVRVGMASDGSPLFSGQHGNIILELETCPVQYRVELSRGVSMTFTASELSLIPTPFKMGDRVQIRAGAVSVGLCFEIGSVGTVCGFDRHGWPEVEQGDERWYYHPDALRPAPALAPGVRVKVLDIKPEEDGHPVIAGVWTSVAGEVCYTLEDDKNTLWHAHELEVLPEPEPKREPVMGEVWRSDGGRGVMLIAANGYPVHLNNGAVVSFTADELARDGYIHFLAASVKEAAEKGLL